VVSLFLAVAAPMTPRPTVTRFQSLGVFAGDLVQKQSIESLQKQKQNTELCISNITTDTLHWVATNMRKRAHTCIAKCGGHF
jgi:hypothetical protein